MNQSGNDRWATLNRIDVIVVVVTCVLIASIILPAIAQSRANDDGANCVMNAKQIMQAMFRFHDAHRYLPLTSSQPITAKPGYFGDAAEPAGYSWWVKLLPYLDDAEFYEQLSFKSRNFTKYLFDPAVVLANDASKSSIKNHRVRFKSCPSFAAHQRSVADQSSATLDDPEQQSAISNYHAFAGTHFFSNTGIGRLAPSDRFHKLPSGRLVVSGYEGNGAMPFPGYAGTKILDRGLGLNALSDGTSTVLTFAETVEQTFAEWADGQATWLIAAWPDNSNLPVGVDQTTGRFSGWPEEQLANNFTSIGKSKMDETGNPDSIYLRADRWSGAEDRRFGPSSYHDGMVTHAFADGSAKLLSANIDKNIYLHLVTRNGRDTIPYELTRLEPGETWIIRDIPEDPEVEEFKSHTDTSQKLAYSIPESWDVFDAPGFAHNVIRIPGTDGRNRNIIINEQPGKSSLVELKQLYERDLPKAFVGFKLLESEIVELGPANKRAVKIIHTNVLPGVPVRQINYIIEVKAKRYFIVCTVMEHDGERFDEAFEKVVESVKSVE